MTVRDRFKEPSVQIRIGLLFLVFASLWRWFVHPSAHLSSNLTDGISGLLYGISIGCTLLGIVRSRRRSA